MKKKILLLLIVVFSLSGCFWEKKSKGVEDYSDVIAGTENIFQFMVSSNYGNPFKGMRNSTYIPADGYVPAIIGYDYNRIQSPIEQYTIQWRDTSSRELEFFRDTVGNNGIIVGITSTPGKYNFRLERGNRVSQEMEITALNEKEYVYTYLKDTYLWNNQIGNLNPDAYTNSEDILEDVVKSSNGKDEWSFMLSKEENESHNSGSKLAYGFWYRSEIVNETTMLALINVDVNSPFYKAGIKRGDRITSIGGYSVKELIGANEDWSKFFEVMSITSQAVDFVIKQGDSSNNFSIKKSEYTTSTVPMAKVIYTGEGKKVGYILFTSFIEMSYGELENAVKMLKNENVTDIIVDLRYNGGGLVDVSNFFASMLGGSKVKGKIFGTMAFNDNYKEFAVSELFKSVQNSMELNKIVFITTDNTASSSELLINSLKPFKNITTVGTNSNGKFVGMFPCEFYDKVMYAINFAEKNSIGVSGDITGIVPDIYAEDNINYDYGDINEDSIKAALEYIKTGVMPPKSAKRIDKTTIKTKHSGKANFFKIY